MRLSVDLHARVGDLDLDVAFDSADPVPLATWWAEQFGAEVTGTNDGWFVTVSGGTLPVGLAFQKVPDPTPGKNRLHLDLRPRADLRDTEIERITAHGATVVADHRGIYGPGSGWVTFADPEGNQFCVLRSAAEVAAQEG